MENMVMSKEERKKELIGKMVKNMSKIQQWEWAGDKARFKEDYARAIEINEIIYKLECNLKDLRRKLMSGNY